MAESNKSKLTPILLILLILFIGLSGYLYYTITQKTATIEELNQNVDDLSERVETLEAIEESLNQQMDETLAELDEFKGLSTELDSLLADAKEDISAKQSRIRQLQKDVRTQKSLTSQLKKEIAELNDLKEQYLNQIDSLIQTNNLLQAQVTEFETQVKSLESTVAEGSIVTAGNITPTPYKQRLLGKYVTTSLARKTEKVEVCFDLLANKIADAGEKQVHIRIMSPEGVTLSNSGEGGTFMAADSTEYRYTVTGIADYANATKNYCVEWMPENELQGGNYKVEVYTEGHYSGLGAFALK